MGSGQLSMYYCIAVAVVHTVVKVEISRGMSETLGSLSKDDGYGYTNTKKQEYG